MKKIFAIVLVAVFVLGMAVSAFAAHLEVTDGESGLKANGSFRLRAVRTSNTTDQSDDAGDPEAWYNQRLRLGLTFIVGDDVSVVTRGDIAEGDWNGKKDTVDNGGYFAIDHAYLVLKKFDLTFNIGLQPANWGNKFWSWANSAERIKVYKNMDGTIVGAFTQKDNEADHGGILNEVDSNAVFVSLPVAEGKLSAIYVNKVDHGTDLDGTVIDVAFKGNVGVAVAAEVVQMSGDLFETAGGNDPMGYFLSVGMDMDGTNIALAYAHTENGFAADNDFGPTLLLGTSVHATGITDLGADAGDDDEASAIAILASMKVSDDLKVGANLAMATLSDAGEKELTEVDVYASYKLATNTSLWAGFAYGMPSDTGWNAAGDDDPITSSALQLVTKF